MSYYRDFREYLTALEERGKLRRIKSEINKDTQLHPLVRLQFRGLPEKQRTAFLFENVSDSRGRKYGSAVAVAALAGSSDIYAIGMKCRPEEIFEKLANAQRFPIEAKMVSSGPVHEEVHMGEGLLEHGGIAEFPIPVTTPGYDVAPYMSAAYWVTKDPETGIPNVGMYRAMVKSPATTGVFWGWTWQGALYHWRKCQERGIPLQAAIIIGGPPNIGYVAVSPVPVGVNEYDVAGGIAGEPVELVKCKTVDLEVPATAEIVIEGEIDTTQVEPEAPFGEALGFIGPREIGPIFNVKCITHRKNPVWLATVSQYPPSESSKIRQYAHESIVFKHLKYDLKMSHVTGVAFYDALGSTRFMAVQVSKTDPDTVWQTLEAASNRLRGAKIIVAVDEDVNIRDSDSVNLAICMRTQPSRDYRIKEVVSPSAMDFSVQSVDKLLKWRDAGAKEMPMASIMLVNACMRWGFPPLSLPKKEFMEEALRIWKQERLPELELKEPWWGINLGFWNEEEDRLAMLATQGESYEAGNLYAQRRRPVQGEKA